VQRNIAHLDVTTERTDESVSTYTVKITLVDRVAVLRAMAKAVGLLGPLTRRKRSFDVASAIEAGYERVRRRGSTAERQDSSSLALPTGVPDRR
jgi:hypothetical protein